MGFTYELNFVNKVQIWQNYKNKFKTSRKPLTSPKPFKKSGKKRSFKTQKEQIFLLEKKTTTLRT
jgi:hypothetical protein